MRSERHFDPLILAMPSLLFLFALETQHCKESISLERLIQDVISLVGAHLGEGCLTESGSKLIKRCDLISIA